MKRVLFVVLLSGCAAAPSDRGGSVEVPVSQQSAVGAARVRSTAHTELGTLYLQNGQFNIALDEANTAIAADPGYALAHKLHAMVLMFLRDDAGARASFEKASSLARDDPEINNDYGWFLCSTGHEAEGLARLKRAALHPLFRTPTRAWFNAGLCAQRVKDDAGAEEYFRRAVAADATNAPALLRYAEALYRRGAYAQARGVVSDRHAVREPDAESLWLAVRVERKLGDRNAEATAVSRLRRKFSDSPQYRDYLQGKVE
ncbi:MAG TPA: type IV pilus biogenesis/stability protein PilW [Rhodocyclaceae bacterium]|nr:MAG: type IV pilus biogenesis/stability protein PilW [Rhodocyclales bacterium CG17_big_fil_post_rev_8_21_14_2_50_68_7]PIX76085.1 MAG: type IV pilus biogenesis/stability protein PilW [Rhodocyclales bacterium CG_4_10_14_3_um_filter_68_10]HCX32353.1 type IV pilus biogenesis/stability protein PilW [Rhodocyclaceae bacterium]